MTMLYKEDYANSENYTCTLSYCKALFWDADYVGLIECSRNFWLGRTIYESFFFFYEGGVHQQQNWPFCLFLSEMFIADVTD